MYLSIEWHAISLWDSQDLGLHLSKPSLRSLLNEVWPLTIASVVSLPKPFGTASPCSHYKSNERIPVI